MLLHTPTLFILSICVSLALAGVLAYVGFRRHPGLLLWAAGLLLNGITYLLYSLRGQVSDQVSVVAANVILATAYAMFIEGVYRFLRRRAPLWVLIAPVAVIAVTFPLLIDAFEARVLLGAVVGCMQMAFVLTAIWTEPDRVPSRGANLLSLGVLSVIMVYLIRGVTVLFVPNHIANIQDSVLIQGVSFLLAILSAMLVGFGLLAMISERSERVLRHEQSVKTFQNRILEMISRAMPLQQILTAQTRGLEELHPRMLCSVLLVDDDGTLRHCAGPSLPPDYNAAVDGLVAGPNAGSCGTAAFRRERVIVEDIAGHPYWADHASHAEKAGLRACWSQPILSSTGVVLGTFAIYHRDVHAPTAEDIGLIERMAGLAGLAIERIRHAEELARSESQYRRLFESANEGICIVQDGQFRVVNPMLESLLGRSAEDLIGRPVIDFILPEDRGLAAMHLARSEQSCELDERCQLRIANPESEIRWLEIGGVRFEFDGRPATLNFVDDVTERRRMDEKIRELAFHDTLTGLPNRRTVIDRLAQTIAANRRSGANAALMFMDLDNFKPLNDRHGHSVGDLLLIEVGHRLRACVREVDTVARFGGDEFAVLLIDLPADPTDAQAAARQLATRMLDSLSQPYRLRVGGRDAARTIEHVCTASIGVHLFGAGPAAPDELIDRADGAMYAAKHAGRHNVRFSGEAG